MIVFRFMGEKEFLNMGAYVPMVHPGHHTKCRTASEGFCFLSAEDFKPEYAIKFLYGIVSADFCVEFEVDEKYLTESWGTYADPCGAWSDTITITEYCTPEYGREAFHPIRYCVPSLDQMVWFPYN